jgi:hypothetical protein
MNYTYLRFGDTLPTVGVLQKLLNRSGAALNVDGFFRVKTRAAVLKFQHEHPPLRADGEVGIQTWARLTEGLNLPIVDCVDVFDTVERRERVRQDPVLLAKFLKLDSNNRAELVAFAKQKELEIEKPDKMTNHQLMHAIGKQLGARLTKTAEWADSYENEPVDIRRAGGQSASRWRHVRRG